MYKTATMVTAAIIAATQSLAAPVDLTDWTSEGRGRWKVAGDGHSVKQKANGDPTVFFASGSKAQGTRLNATIQSLGGDDDYVGFVLGYDAGELNSTDADFWLIDWKQKNQNYRGSKAYAGLTLSHVTGNTGRAGTDFWTHSGIVQEVQRGATLGSTGYVRKALNEFSVIFTKTLIEVSVNGNVELSYSGDFEDGAFGLYNFSQEKVVYQGITSEAVPSQVPLPATGLMLMAGLGAGAFVRRRRG